MKTETEKRGHGTLTTSESLFELAAEMNRQKITEADRYKRFKYYLSEKAWEKGVPIVGVFELTPLCNLDCKMCYVHLSPAQMRGRELLSAETWINLIDQAREAGMFSAQLSGGECLTYPGFAQVYRHIASHGMEASLLTNGVLVTDELIQLFRDYPPAFIQVTLYGSDDDAYERVTGHRVFSQVMAGIERLRSADLPVKIGVTPNHFMGQDAEKTIALLSERGITYDINAGMFAAREETGRCMADYDLALDDEVRLLKYAAALHKKRVDPRGEEELPRERIIEEGGKGIKCSAGRSMFAIAWDGVMRGCNVLSNPRAYPLRDGFLSAWQTVNREAREYALPEECLACEYERVCKQCVAEHQQGAEAGHANPAVCAWTKRMVLEGLRTLPSPPEDGQGSGSTKKKKAIS